VLKRFMVIGGIAALVLGAFPLDSAAQVRRAPVRRVIVVPAYVSPYSYYDPWFGFYDYPWGYPPYGPYGYYRRYEPESSMRLEVKPKQAEVFVDGYYAGIVDDFDGTFQRLRVPPGEHEITLYLAGYRTVHQKVYLTPDNTFKIKYELEKLGPGEQPEPRPQPSNPPAVDMGGAQPPSPYPAPPQRPGSRRGPPPQARAPRPEMSGYGSLAIRVQPQDAEVIVDGERWNAPEGQPQVVIELPGGRHTVQIQKPGYRSYIADVEVRPGETTPLNVSLRSQEE
jgi:hypothetical protein